MESFGTLSLEQEEIIGTSVAQVVVPATVFAARNTRSMPFMLSLHFQTR